LRLLRLNRCQKKRLLLQRIETNALVSQLPLAPLLSFNIDLSTSDGLKPPNIVDSLANIPVDLLTCRHAVLTPGTSEKRNTFDRASWPFLCAG
jgi:hypothetical protein